MIFSNTKEAKKPYHIKNVDLMIYSLEEFCYFFACNMILLDKSIQQDDFEDWIEQELQFKVLAENLRQQREQGISYEDYFIRILNSIFLYTAEEKDQIEREIRLFANKNELQKRKTLADDFFTRRKYEQAIGIYSLLIHSKVFAEQSDIFQAKIWYNMGCCYGKCFMFEEALRCFKSGFSIAQLSEIQQGMVNATEAKQLMKVDKNRTSDSWGYETSIDRSERLRLNKFVSEYVRGVKE